MPTIQANHVHDLLHVSRLLRQHAGNSRTESQGSDHDGLFLAAAEALELRAQKLANQAKSPLRLVDLHC